jgi:hypothetical protein
MTRPLVVMKDAEQVVVNYLRSVIGTDSNLTGYTVGTKVASGMTPKMFLQVRKIGGDRFQRIAERPRLDVRVWDQAGADFKRMQTARRALAHLCTDLGCAVMAEPVNLPDPADPTIDHTLFTVEPVLKGDQE